MPAQVVLLLGPARTRPARLLPTAACLCMATFTFTRPPAVHVLLQLHLPGSGKSTRISMRMLLRRAAALSEQCPAMAGCVCLAGGQAWLPLPVASSSSSSNR